MVLDALRLVERPGVVFQSQIGIDIKEIVGLKDLPIAFLE